MMDLVTPLIGTTLDRFIKIKQKDFPFATGELSQLLQDISLACKILNRDVNKAGLVDVSGSLGNLNVQGEAQQKLDVIAEDRIIRALTNGGQVCAILSEERDKVIEVNAESEYIVAIDPLDGSSNIDVNVSIGTIFSIYRRLSSPGQAVSTVDILQKGLNQVAAGYVLYGSSTMLVYTTGNGVNGFTYEPSLGEFILSHKNIQTPKDGFYFSINEGLYHDFDDSIIEYIKFCKEQKYSARYIGSLVADFHRNLLKGGIYMYPGTKELVNGKIRLMYEANSLAFIVEQSGGMAFNGHQRILEIEPMDFHQRCPFLIGSENMVIKALSYID
jgi:fructose-1,6-bisphosphatase I